MNKLDNSSLSARVDMQLVSHDVFPNALITLKPEGGIVMRLEKVRTEQLQVVGQPVMAS